MLDTLTLQYVYVGAGVQDEAGNEIGEVIAIVALDRSHIAVVRAKNGPLSQKYLRSCNISVL